MIKNQRGAVETAMILWIASGLIAGLIGFLNYVADNPPPTKTPTVTADSLPDEQPTIR